MLLLPGRQLIFNIIPKMKNRTNNRLLLQTNGAGAGVWIETPEK